MDLIRADRREIFRLAVFLCNTPLVTPRMISGCAAVSAEAAACLSPEEIASSTDLRKVRIRDLRARLTSVRRRVCLTRLIACCEFAIASLSGACFVQVHSHMDRST